jgi:hypothetical protein
LLHPVQSFQTRATDHVRRGSTSFVWRLIRIGLLPQFFRATTIDLQEMAEFPLVYACERESSHELANSPHVAKMAEKKWVSVLCGLCPYSAS